MDSRLGSRLGSSLDKRDVKMHDLTINLGALVARP